jgi:putative ABC transport system permease protein
LTLTDKYTNKTYDLTVTGIWGSSANMNVYMDRIALNRMIDEDDDNFAGYASDEELTLDARYIATDITPEAMDSSADQMERSFGDLMDMVVAFAVPVYLILVYLLTKTVIDRSARSISYMKVFGYHSGEVDGLYIHPITIFVLLSLLASIPLIIALLAGLLKVVFSRYAGNFPINIPPDRLALLVLVGMVAYGAVAALHVRRIRKVPLSLALKVQE